MKLSMESPERKAGSTVRDSQTGSLFPLLFSLVRESAARDLATESVFPGMLWEVLICIRVAGLLGAKKFGDCDPNQFKYMSLQRTS